MCMYRSCYVSGFFRCEDLHQRDLSTNGKLVVRRDALGFSGYPRFITIPFIRGSQKSNRNPNHQLTTTNDCNRYNDCNHYWYLINLHDWMKICHVQLGSMHQVSSAIFPSATFPKRAPGGWKLNTPSLGSPVNLADNGGGGGAWRAVQQAMHVCT